METFFAQGNLSEEQMKPALRRRSATARSRRSSSPRAATTRRASRSSSTRSSTCCPTADSFQTVAKNKAGQSEALAADPAGPAAAFVFKTISDPYSGRLTLFRVVSGTFKSDGTYWNASRETAERFGPVFSPLGKTMQTVPEIPAGDIGGVAKLKETLTGDSLSAKEKPFVFAPPSIPEPAIAFAIEPKSKGDEDKISIALAQAHRGGPVPPLLAGRRHARVPARRRGAAPRRDRGRPHEEEERASRSSSTRRRSRTARRSRAPPKGTAATRSRRAGTASSPTARSASSRSPAARTSSSSTTLYGGSIPRNYVPAVEKGIQDVRKRGFLAGFPMVDFRVELYDGQYHDVDSSEMAFKIAGSLAYKDAMEKAKPTILEPIMKIAIRAPQEYMGDLMGDLTSRRGRPAGHGPGGRRLDHPRRGPARRDDLLRVDPPGHHAGARLVPHGDGPLRGSPASPAGEAHRRARRSTGRWRSSRSSGNLDPSDLH